VPQAGTQRPSKLARGGAVVGVLFSLLYLINPGFGWIEMLPDNLPIVGNLDEVGVTGLLVYCLRVLGLEVIPRGRNAGKGS
jgi:uncharacterized membrane protein YkvA (DUF1232 family)